MEKKLTINPGKAGIVENGGKIYLCRAIHTTVVTPKDKLEDVVENFVVPVVEPGDVVFLSEKMVACTEGRAYPIDGIKAGLAARVLCPKFCWPRRWGRGGSFLGKRAGSTGWRGRRLRPSTAPASTPCRPTTIMLCLRPKIPGRQPGRYPGSLAASRF